MDGGRDILVAPLRSHDGYKLRAYERGLVGGAARGRHSAIAIAFPFEKIRIVEESYARSAADLGDGEAARDLAGATEDLASRL